MCVCEHDNIIKCDEFLLMKNKNIILQKKKLEFLILTYRIDRFFSFSSQFFKNMNNNRKKNKIKR